MSASTVSITANTAAAARRTPVISGEKKSNLDFLASESLANGGVRETAGTSRDLIRAEAVVERSPSNSVPVIRKTASAATGTNAATTTQRRTRKVATPKPPEKPRWKRVLRVFAKQLSVLLLLAGLIQVARKVILRDANTSPPSSFGSEIAFSELEGRIAEVDGFVKTATKMIQVQVEVLDKKLDKEAKALRQTIDESTSALKTELNKIESSFDRLEKSVDDLNAQTWVSKDELERIYEELKKDKDDESAVDDINLDEVRAYARDIVEKEIEKHAADGLGRVDYALASGGAFVTKHSEPFLVGKGSNWFGTNRVHTIANKMLSPSFGEPGQCFPLKGSNGYVQIRLRAPIIPEAVTLEHVAKSVAYDRSSAPKDCRVSGWFHGQDMDSGVETEKMLLLTEFTYDLDKSNAQTFEVADSARGSGLVDTVRLDFTSNHGNGYHTCIYRFRVHGRTETEAISVLPTEA